MDPDGVTTPALGYVHQLLNEIAYTPRTEIARNIRLNAEQPCCSSLTLATRLPVRPLPISDQCNNLKTRTSPRAISIESALLRCPSTRPQSLLTGNNYFNWYPLIDNFRSLQNACSYSDFFRTLKSEELRKLRVAATSFFDLSSLVIETISAFSVWATIFPKTVQLRRRAAPAMDSPCIWPRRLDSWPIAAGRSIWTILHSGNSALPIYRRYGNKSR